MTISTGNRSEELFAFFPAVGSRCKRIDAKVFSTVIKHPRLNYLLCKRWTHSGWMKKGTFYNRNWRLHSAEVTKPPGGASKLNIKEQTVIELLFASEQHIHNFTAIQSAGADTELCAHNQVVLKSGIYSSGDCWACRPLCNKPAACSFKLFVYNVQWNHTLLLETNQQAGSLHQWVHYSL